MADPSRLRWDEFHSRMGILFKLFEEIPLRKAIWLNYFTPTQLTLLTQPNPPSEELATTLKNDFDALVEFDRQNESLTPDEKILLKSFFNLPERGTTLNWRDSF